MTEDRPAPSPARERYVYYPGTSGVPEDAAVNIRNRSFAITAEFEAAGAPEGVIFSHGSRFGGHTVYVKDRRLHYVYSFLGIQEYRFTADAPLSPGRHVAVVRFEKTHEDPRWAANGTLTLSLDGDTMASGPMRTQPGKFSVAGLGLTIGRHSGDPVTDDYTAPFPFTGGTIDRVTVEVPLAQDLDTETEADAILAQD